MPVKLHNGGLLVFICFSHRDNKWREQLLVHLEQLKWNYHVDFWSSPSIELGARWDEEIGDKLQNAGAAILLVSPNFISSSYIRNRELPLLLRREEGREVEIIPVHAERADVDGRFKYPDPESGPRHKFLTDFQSPSDPHNPLEAMTPYEQNVLLVKVARRIAALAPPKDPPPTIVVEPTPPDAEGPTVRGRKTRWLRIVLPLTLLALAAAVLISLWARRGTSFMWDQSRTPTAVSLRVIKPSEGETVNLSQQVWGETPYPTWNHYIVVKPPRYNCEGMVAAQASMEGNGWTASAVFGQRNADSGKQLKVFVLATQAQLPKGPLCGWPQGSQVSAPVTVIRK